MVALGTYTATLTAKDSAGNNVGTGGELVYIFITNECTISGNVCNVVGGATATLSTPITGDMTDNGDGTYSYSFTLENNSGKVTGYAYKGTPGITTEWFENFKFKNPSTVTNTTSLIDYYWNGSTDLIVGTTYVAASIIFDTNIRAPYTGSVVFTVETDFKMDFTFNGALSISAGNSGTYTTTQTVTKNNLYPVNIRWNNQGGDATIKVYYSYTGQASTIIPATHYLLSTSI